MAANALITKSEVLPYASSLCPLLGLNRALEDHLQSCVLAMRYCLLGPTPYFTQIRVYFYQCSRLGECGRCTLFTNPSFFRSIGVGVIPSQELLCFHSLGAS